jgi:hypothetical protein
VEKAGRAGGEAGADLHRRNSSDKGVRAIFRE